MKNHALNNFRESMVLSFEANAVIDLPIGLISSFELGGLGSLQLKVSQELC